MSLREKLEAQQVRALGSWSEQERAIRLGAIEETAASGIAERALGAGDAVPQIVLRDAAGEAVDVGSLLQSGPVVLSFYRGSWCPYCNLELRALQEHLAEFQALGAQLVAVSPELPERSLVTAHDSGLGFPLLFDEGNAVASSFGILHEIAEGVVELQRRNGNDVAVFNGSPVAEVPLPASYVIGADGVIRYAFVDADYRRRAEPEELLEALRGLR